MQRATNIEPFFDRVYVFAAAADEKVLSDPGPPASTAAKTKVLHSHGPPVRPG